VYPPGALFPGNDLAFRSDIYFVMPLVCQGKRLGYVIYDKADGQQTLYSIVTRDLAKSLFICKLIEERKEAEANLEYRNRELQDFAHIASHDLQEPLKKIMVFGEKLHIAFEKKADPDELDYFKRLLHATVRMRQLISGLLSYSRVSTQGQSFGKLDLNSIVAEVLIDLEVRLSETGGKVISGNLPVVYADPLQMRQLFQNLIGNALKYHRSGVPPVITIDAAVENEHYKITISDNGIGFDNKNSERIFGMFQRAVGKNEYEGTGVGLAICKKIADRHGGSISACGDPGNGSVFTFRMPVKRKS
jgi:light-regulated signal transduction histidine kinase (bacteriophytochrome)